MTTSGAFHPSILLGPAPTYTTASAAAVLRMSLDCNPKLYNSSFQDPRRSLSSLSELSVANQFVWGGGSRLRVAPAKVARALVLHVTACNNIWSRFIEHHDSGCARTH